jgi:hypothetical protein
LIEGVEDIGGLLDAYPLADTEGVAELEGSALAVDFWVPTKDSRGDGDG